MQAKDCVNGQMYQLGQRDWRPSCVAECYGLNYSNDFMLFLFFDNWGARKILAIPLNEEVVKK